MNPALNDAVLMPPPPFTPTRKLTISSQGPLTPPRSGPSTPKKTFTIPYNVTPPTKPKPTFIPVGGLRRSDYAAKAFFPRYGISPNLFPRDPRAKPSPHVADWHRNWQGIDPKQAQKHTLDGWTVKRSKPIECYDSDRDRGGIAHFLFSQPLPNDPSLKPSYDSAIAHWEDVTGIRQRREESRQRREDTRRSLQAAAEARQHAEYERFHEQRRGMYERRAQHLEAERQAAEKREADQDAFEAAVLADKQVALEEELASLQADLANVRAKQNVLMARKRKRETDTDEADEDADVKAQDAERKRAWRKEQLARRERESQGRSGRKAEEPKARKMGSRQTKLQLLGDL